MPSFDDILSVYRLQRVELQAWIEQHACRRDAPDQQTDRQCEQRRQRKATINPAHRREQMAFLLR